MATIVECIAEDGSVVYVNLNNVNAFSSRGDKGGTLFRFAGGDSLAVATPGKLHNGPRRRKAALGHCPSLSLSSRRRLFLFALASSRDGIIPGPDALFSTSRTFDLSGRAKKASTAHIPPNNAPKPRTTPRNP
jgi:hypothetical protein